jgi:hypothetical protein
MKADIKSDSLRKTFVLFVSFASLLCIAVGVYFAVHSPLFLVQVVEVGDQPDGAPVDPQKILELAAVPVGKVNLFELNLATVEKRILSHPWIRQVNLQKRFPQTLSVSVVFREPRALLQDKSGGLAYVDVGGQVFGSVNVLARSDLPMLTGFLETDKPRIEKALGLLDLWDHSPLSQIAQIASLSWDEDRGYHAWIVYSFSASQGRARTPVDLGDDLEKSSLELQFKRLDSVFQYLSKHSITANQIWADSGKKIVVRTAHGS